MNKVQVDKLNENIYMEVLYGCDTPYDVTNIEYWMDEYESELVEESIIIGNDLSQGFLVLILLEGYEGDISGMMDIISSHPMMKKILIL